MSRTKLLKKNLTGSILRKHRENNGLTQDDVARRCQLMGWDISRDTITKIELNRRLVADYEIYLFATALRIPVQRLIAKNPVLNEFVRIADS
jgi:transcriptional regulator with XRE-family HTH domain